MGLHNLARCVVCIDMNSTTMMLLSVFCVPTFLCAQSRPLSVFRLQIRMQESGPQMKETTKSYVMLVQAESRGKINASQRVPFYGKTGEVHTVALGSIMECDAREAEGGVRLDCGFESSYVAPKQPAQPRPVGFPPILESRQVSTKAVIPLGTEVSMAELDDPASGNRLRIFMSAERVNAVVR